MYQVVLVAPVGHACAPSYIWHRLGAVLTLGTQTCPAAQPPPNVIVLQKRPLVAQLGAAADGVPLGLQVPLTVAVNGPATMPNALNDMFHSGLMQPTPGVSDTAGIAVPAVQAPGLSNAATVVLHAALGREHEHPEQLPGVRFCITTIASG